MTTETDAPTLRDFLPVGEGSLDRLEAQLHWTLRLTAALCFIGHGAWGVITKEGWLPFFDVVGIPHAVAWKMMPVIGLFDIAMGFALLVKPRRAIAAWMVVWAVWTAALRPLAGMGGWEFLERAGNYVPPAALIVLAGGFAWRTRGAWLEELPRPRLTLPRIDVLHWMLRLAVATLLVGHAGFGLFQRKAMLVGHYRALGIDADPAFVAGVGVFEFVLAAAVLFRPTVGTLFLVLGWKVVSELLYPLSGSALDVFETIERWGDYGAPIAMIQIQLWRRQAGLREAAPLLEELPRIVRRDLAAILGGAALLTFVALIFDLDRGIAARSYDAATGEFQGVEVALLAFDLAAASFFIALGLLIWLAIPRARRRFPDFSRVAALFVVTMLIAVLGGVHNLKRETFRPRPEQVTEFDGKYAFTPPFGSEKRCKRCVSFPSSAAGFGFLVCTPFFVYRRKRPTLARGFLVGGLVWGSLIGWFRMVGGRHWFTDIVWSAALVLAVLAVLAALESRWRPRPGTPDPPPGD